MTIQKKGVIYTRFSSDRQTELSTDAQLRVCREYAAAHDINIVAVYSDEAISGKGTHTFKRDQYKAMLRDASRQQFDVILIHKYDRVARNLAEHVNLDLKLASYDVNLIAISQDFGTSNEAKLVRALMWSLSEYYIDNLSSETKKGHRELALKAMHNGGYVPFGYSIEDGKYKINQQEYVWVRKMGECALNRTGFTRLISEMASAGIVGRRGKPITYSQIYEILNNEKYAGVYVYSVDQEKARSDRRKKPNAIRIEDAIPAIFTKEEFAEIQNIMREHKHTSPQTDYLCSGKVYCSCGAKMHVFKSTNKGHTYLYYRCSAKCGMPGIPVSEVDNTVYSYLNNLLSEKTQQKILSVLRDLKRQEKILDNDFSNILIEKIKEKEKEYNTLMKNLSSGMLPAPVIEDIGNRMNEIKNEIEILKETKPPKGYSAPYILNWLNSLKEVSPDESVKLLLDKIDIKTKNTIEAHSTLTAFLGNLGCGGRI